MTNETSLTTNIRMHLTLIIGPMFSGKSTNVIRRIRKAQALGLKTLNITSILDNRYDSSSSRIITHDKEYIEALGVKVLEGIELSSEYKEADLIVIEEAQFFSGLRGFVMNAIENNGKNVIVAGLNGDSDRAPFGEILDLIPMADEIYHLMALCKRCDDGCAALFTALVNGCKDGEQICVGGADKYEAMCRRHYLENLKTKKRPL